MKQQVSHEDYVQMQRQHLCEIAKVILAGDLGIIAGVRQLLPFRHEIELAQAEDDFQVLVGIDSETGHLPVGSQQLNWTEAALRKKEKEIVEVEAHAAKDVLRICQRLLAKLERSTNTFGA